jgi:hypothetical protein
MRMADRQTEGVGAGGEQERLLEGEQPDTHVGADATHWIEVYTELRSINLRVLENLKAITQSQSGTVTHEAQPDLDALALQLQRFERRLAFWQRRLAELDGHSGLTGSKKPE